MKKWTKAFLDKLPPSGTASYEYVKSNSRKANKKIKFPKELWIELSREAGLANTWEIDHATIFCAGMAVGWAEHEKSVK